MPAPVPGFTLPITSLAEARSIFHETFSGLGGEYQTAFDALLDPANGRAGICREEPQPLRWRVFHRLHGEHEHFVFRAAMTEPSRTSRSLRTKADMQSIASL